MKLNVKKLQKAGTIPLKQDYQFYKGQYNPELRNKIEARIEANKPVNTTSAFILDNKTMTAKRNPNAKMGLEIVSPEFQLLTAGVGSLAGKASTIIGKIGQTMLHGAGQGAMANMSNLSGSEQSASGLAQDVLGGAVVGGLLKGVGVGVKPTSKYILNKAEPYLMGDKRIPMMGGYKPKMNLLENSFDLLPIDNIKRPNGAIGTQGVTTEQVSNILTNVLNLNVPKNASMRELVDLFKSNPNNIDNLIKFTKKNPINISKLPDGSFHIKDGHHRAFLLDQAGIEKIPYTNFKKQGGKMIPKGQHGLLLNKSNTLSPLDPNKQFNNSKFNFLNLSKQKPLLNLMNMENIGYDSNTVLKLIDDFEGFKDKVYKDGKGIDTIGHGLTDKKYISKRTITKEESLSGVKSHIDKEVIPHLKNKPYWNNLNDNQKSALISYIFNIGSGNFNTKSPSLQKALSEGNWNEAAKQMDFGYNDKKNPGLRKRRDKERQLFLQ